MSAEVESNPPSALMHFILIYILQINAKLKKTRSKWARNSVVIYAVEDYSHYTI